MVDVSLKHYQNIEYGITIPTVTIALHLCEVLDIDPREVTNGKTGGNRPKSCAFRDKKGCPFWGC
ncbi:helix-turn-helix domain-containing protein [Brevibacillus formosus]|uniref:helix-turn-helix domain-containing protein n=1 Tax=Brevibacillus formosus TaxID=54913 RepID=UPI003F1D4569